MSKLSRENTGLKLKGAGDGLKTPSARKAERVPVPSSRKFTATPVRDENVQLRLKKALDDLESNQNKLKKSKTVAEITPTKSKNPRRPDATAASVALHATPRPPPPSAAPPPPKRLDEAACRKMLLFVWRRTKARLGSVNDSLRRRQEQILNLEKQVNCLKDLTHAECHKRGEAINEYQRMETLLDKIKAENECLISEKQTLEKELEELGSRFEALSTDLENVKNELQTKNIYVKRLENERNKERTTTKKLLAENELLVENIKTKDADGRKQEENWMKLNSTLNSLKERLRHCETENSDTVIELAKMKKKYESKACSFKDLKEEFQNICFVRNEMMIKIETLENELVNVSNELEKVSMERDFFKERYAERKIWWKNAREFILVTWGVLQNAAYLMLPALQ